MIIIAIKQEIYWIVNRSISSTPQNRRTKIVNSSSSLTTPTLAALQALSLEPSPSYLTSPTSLTSRLLAPVAEATPSFTSERVLPRIVPEDARLTC